MNLFSPDHTTDIIDVISGFSEFGSPTKIQRTNETTYLVNEFWTSRQRQANRIHEVSYRACFKPQLPAFFIEKLTSEGDIVYDPFMGRGTTPIEAALRGRTPYGNDVNPLSRAFVEPRINAPHLDEIYKRLEEIPWETFVEFEREDLLVFFHPKTLAQIEGLRSWLISRELTYEFDLVDAWIRMVAVNRLTGHSSGFFSVYTLPPNQAVTAERQARINEKRNQIPPERDIVAILKKKSKSLLSQQRSSSRSGLFTTGQASHTPTIPDDVVSLTVTSPPFLDIVNYEADNWLRCWFIGVDPKSVPISIHKKVEDWQEFVSLALIELERVTKVGGHIAFEVGEVRNGSVRLEENVVAAARKTNLEVLGVMINQQDFTKTSNCWGVSNNSSGTNSNRIVILRK